jgi:pyruvate/2-oxoglutarate/acetoin dehydrogenase E1 component
MQQVRDKVDTGSSVAAAVHEMTYAQALNRALAEELERDPSVIVMGEDVGAYGGVFGVTRDLQARFGPRRVLDTPISETGFLGCAVGAAMCGLRPVVEIMFVDFTLVCMDQIVNQAAKLPFLTGGQVRMPIVFRTQQGARPGTAAQHSQCLEALLAPATPADAYGMLKAAIRSDDPVVYLEHKALYATVGPVRLSEYIVPIGMSNTVRSGSHVTALTYSAMVPVVLSAADALAEDGISVEVIDLRSLAPLDEAAVLESVKRTGHVVVIHEGWRRGGYGAELAGLIQELAFDWLDAPVGRMGARDVPKPFSPVFDSVYLPTKDSVISALRSTLC